MQEQSLAIDESPTPSPCEEPDPNGETLVEAVARFFREQLPTVDGFQERSSQLEMALAIAKTIQDKTIMTVEAGTGTGKSLAYLVPLLLHESSNKAPCIIATKTVQLQQQLLNKDLPTLQKLLKAPRSVVRAKGWSNYVCIRKVESPDEHSLRELGPTLPQLRELLFKHSGRLTKQETFLNNKSWDRVKADPLDCQKRNCPHFARCGLFAERRELESAEVIVTNHAFLLTDLRMRREGRGLLPQGEVLVIDEAHRLDDVATEHLAVRFDPDRLFSCVTSPLLSASDGWLAATRFTFLMTLPDIDFQNWSLRFDQRVLLALKDLELLATDIFAEIRAVARLEQNLRLPLAELLHAEVGERLANLSSEMCLGLEEFANDLTQLCRDYEDSFHLAPPGELVRLAQSLARLGHDLQFLLECDSEDWVYLCESESQSLLARPVDNSEALQTELFAEYSSVVTTSASLQVSDSFHFFKTRCGLKEEAPEHAFRSPFKFAQNSFIGLTNTGPEPSSPDYPTHLLPSLVELAIGLQGRTFILTTSHRRVHEFKNLLSGPLAQSGIEVLAQGQESASQLLRRFVAPGMRILVGVDTFWEGVDIPGERLSCVVMTRLPFPVPSDALFEARAKKIESSGGHAFRDLSLPLAGLKMKQGFGRLLRSEADKGLFLLTDPRAMTKSYGRELLRNLPCKHAVCGSTHKNVEEALDWSSRNLRSNPNSSPNETEPPGSQNNTEPALLDVSGAPEGPLESE